MTQLFALATLAFAGREQRPLSPDAMTAWLRRLCRRERRIRRLLWSWAMLTLIWLMPLSPLAASRLPASAAIAVGGFSLVCGALLITLYRVNSHPRAAYAALRAEERPTTR